MRTGRSKKWKRLLLVPVIILAAAALFFGLFYVTDVEVVGNTRYTETQIAEMVLQGPLAHNSILMSQMHRNIRPDAAFIESVHVTYRGRNSLRLEVQEKYPIGYLQIDHTNYYFDKDGLVLEAIASDEADSGKRTGNAGTDAEDPDTGEGTLSPQENVSSTSSVSAESQSAFSGNAENGDARNKSDTTFRPALTDVPLISGLEASNVRVGQTLTVEKPAIFQTILSLTKLIDKFSVQPDYVEISNGSEMTLHYEKVRIEIGTDSYLEEKMSRLAAILPELNGMSGVLHLEDYTKETQNIIFDRDQTEKTSGYHSRVNRSMI